ncbi:MAG: thioredoxin family protein [Verrucomicrobiota bacterium]
MKKSTFAAAFCLFAFHSPLFAGGEGWSSDFEAAKKSAVENKTDLLIDFTGSDWCAVCIRLNEEVFSKDPFKSGVKDKFTLVEIDSPKDAAKLKEATKKQNAKLVGEYDVRGFPSIVLADSTGKPYAVTGYQEGGAEKYVAHLNELRDGKAKRDKAFADAAKLEGVPKASALISALKAMKLEDSLVAKFYGDVVEQIKAADPKDEAGFVKAAESSRKIADMKGQLGDFASKNDHKGALALVEKTIAEGGFTKESTQELILTKAAIHAQMGEWNKAIQAVDNAREAYPDSPIDSKIQNFKKRIEGARDEAATANDTKKAPPAEKSEKPKDQEAE